MNGRKNYSRQISKSPRVPKYPIQTLYKITNTINSNARGSTPTSAGTIRASLDACHGCYFPEPRPPPEYKNVSAPPIFPFYLQEKKSEAMSGKRKLKDLESKKSFLMNEKFLKNPTHYTSEQRKSSLTPQIPDQFYNIPNKQEFQQTTANNVYFSKMKNNATNGNGKTEASGIAENYLVNQMADKNAPSTEEKRDTLGKPSESVKPSTPQQFTEKSKKKTLKIYPRPNGSLFPPQKRSYFATDQKTPLKNFSEVPNRKFIDMHLNNSPILKSDLDAHLQKIFDQKKFIEQPDMRFNFQGYDHGKPYSSNMLAKDLEDSTYTLKNLNSLGVQDLSLSQNTEVRFENNRFRTNTFSKTPGAQLPNFQKPRSEKDKFLSSGTDADTEDNDYPESFLRAMKPRLRRSIHPPDNRYNDDENFPMPEKLPKVFKRKFGRKRSKQRFPSLDIRDSETDFPNDNNTEEDTTLENRIPTMSSLPRSKVPSISNFIVPTSNERPGTSLPSTHKRALDNKTQEPYDKKPNNLQKNVLGSQHPEKQTYENRENSQKVFNTSAQSPLNKAEFPQKQGKVRESLTERSGLSKSSVPKEGVLGVSFKTPDNKTINFPNQKPLNLQTNTLPSTFPENQAYAQAKVKPTSNYNPNSALNQKAFNTQTNALPSKFSGNQDPSQPKLKPGSEYKSTIDQNQKTYNTQTNVPPHSSRNQDSTRMSAKPNIAQNQKPTSIQSNVTPLLPGFKDNTQAKMKQVPEYKPHISQNQIPLPAQTNVVPSNFPGNQDSTRTNVIPTTQFKPNIVQDQKPSAISSNVTSSGLPPNQDNAQAKMKQVPEYKSNIAQNQHPLTAQTNVVPSNFPGNQDSARTNVVPSIPFKPNITQNQKPSAMQTNITPSPPPGRQDSNQAKTKPAPEYKLSIAQNQHPLTPQTNVVPSNFLGNQDPIKTNVTQTAQFKPIIAQSQKPSAMQTNITLSPPPGRQDNAQAKMKPAPEYKSSLVPFNVQTNALPSNFSRNQDSSQTQTKSAPEHMQSAAYSTSQKSHNMPATTHPSHFPDSQDPTQAKMKPTSEYKQSTASNQKPFVAQTNAPPSNFLRNQDPMQAQTKPAPEHVQSAAHSSSQKSHNAPATTHPSHLPESQDPTQAKMKPTSEYKQSTASNQKPYVAQTNAPPSNFLRNQDPMQAQTKPEYLQSAAHSSSQKSHSVPASTYPSHFPESQDPTQAKMKPTSEYKQSTASNQKTYVAQTNAPPSNFLRNQDPMQAQTKPAPEHAQSAAHSSSQKSHNVPASTYPSHYPENQDPTQTKMKPASEYKPNIAQLQNSYNAQTNVFPSNIPGNQDPLKSNLKPTGQNQKPLNTQTNNLPLTFSANPDYTSPSDRRENISRTTSKNFSVVSDNKSASYGQKAFETQGLEHKLPLLDQNIKPPYLEHRDIGAQRTSKVSVRYPFLESGVPANILKSISYQSEGSTSNPSQCSKCSSNKDAMKKLTLGSKQSDNHYIFSDSKPLFPENIKILSSKTSIRPENTGFEFSKKSQTLKDKPYFRGLLNIPENTNTISSQQKTYYNKDFKTNEEVPKPSAPIPIQKIPESPEKIPQNHTKIPLHPTLPKADSLQKTQDTKPIPTVQREISKPNSLSNRKVIDKNKSDAPVKKKTLDKEVVQSNAPSARPTRQNVAFQLSKNPESDPHGGPKLQKTHDNHENNELFSKAHAKNFNVYTLEYDNQSKALLRTIRAALKQKQLAKQNLEFSAQRSRFIDPNAVLQDESQKGSRLFVEAGLPLIKPPQNPTSFSKTNLQNFVVYPLDYNDQNNTLVHKMSPALYQNHLDNLNVLSNATNAQFVSPNVGFQLVQNHENDPQIGSRLFLQSELPIYITPQYSGNTDIFPSADPKRFGAYFFEFDGGNALAPIPNTSLYQNFFDKPDLDSRAPNERYQLPGSQTSLGIIALSPWHPSRRVQSSEYTESLSPYYENATPLANTTAAFFNVNPSGTQDLEYDALGNKFAIDESDIYSFGNSQSDFQSNATGFSQPDFLKFDDLQNLQNLPGVEPTLVTESANRQPYPFGYSGPYGALSDQFDTFFCQNLSGNQVLECEVPELLFSGTESGSLLSEKSYYTLSSETLIPEPPLPKFDVPQTQKYSQFFGHNADFGSPGLQSQEHCSPLESSAFTAGRSSPESFVNSPTQTSGSSCFTTNNPYAMANQTFSMDQSICPAGAPLTQNSPVNRVLCPGRFTSAPEVPLNQSYTMGPSTGGHLSSVNQTYTFDQSRGSPCALNQTFGVGNTTNSPCSPANQSYVIDQNTGSPCPLNQTFGVGNATGSPRAPGNQTYEIGQSYSSPCALLNQTYVGGNNTGSPQSPLNQTFGLGNASGNPCPNQTFTCSPYSNLNQTFGPGNASGGPCPPQTYGVSGPYGPVQQTPPGMEHDAGMIDPSRTMNISQPFMNRTYSIGSPSPSGGPIDPARTFDVPVCKLPYKTPNIIRVERKKKELSFNASDLDSSDPDPYSPESGVEFFSPDRKYQTSFMSSRTPCGNTSYYPSVSSPNEPPIRASTFCIEYKDPPQSSPRPSLSPQDKNRFQPVGEDTGEDDLILDLISHHLSKLSTPSRGICTGRQEKPKCLPKEPPKKTPSKGRTLPKMPELTDEDICNLIQCEKEDVNSVSYLMSDARKVYKKPCPKQQKAQMNVQNIARSITARPTTSQSHSPEYGKSQASAIEPDPEDISPELAANMMFSQEEGIELEGPPTKTVNYLFPESKESDQDKIAVVGSEQNEEENMAQKSPDVPEEGVSDSAYAKTMMIKGARNKSGSYDMEFALGQEKREYVLVPKKPQRYNKIQFRGNLPTWFPGYFSSFPDDHGGIKLVSSPSQLLQKAWMWTAPLNLPPTDIIILD